MRTFAGPLLDGPVRHRREDPLATTGRAGHADRARFESDALPYMPQMFPTALRLTGDRRDAEDLLQETFARAYAKFHQYTPGASLRAWLYTIMTRTFYSACRARGCRPAEVPAADLLADIPGQSGVTLARTAEAEALDRLGDSAVMRALAELPSHLKTVVYLADVQGYRYGEIAHLIGAPVGTVKARIHRARKILRARLGSRQLASAASAAGLDAAAA
jgi:RNA polymerase sigma-70 factor, ECF subfamily